MRPLEPGEVVINDCLDRVGAGPPAQEIVLDFPPIYSEIAAVFRIHECRDVVFSFGPRLYNPYGLTIATEILAHEAIHGVRQRTGDHVLDWWKRYMEEPKFRLAEEAQAHRAEYRWLLAHGARKQRRKALKQVAIKLASPLYGRLVNADKARRILKATAYE